MVKIIMLHGFLSSPLSRKFTHFQSEIQKYEINNYITEIIVLDLYSTKKEFENMTVSGLVLKINKLIEESDDPIWLVGSSHGGLLALATILSGNNKVKGVILLAPAIKFYRSLSLRYNIDSWKADGYVELNHPRFENLSRLGFGYYEDLELYSTFTDLKLPVLLIHGKKDNIVPIDDSRKFSLLQSDCSEYYPADGNHNLNNVLQEITEIMISWLTVRM